MKTNANQLIIAFLKIKTPVRIETIKMDRAIGRGFTPHTTLVEIIAKLANKFPRCFLLIYKITVSIEL